MNSFFWTGRTTFPYVYRDADKTWLYYQQWTNPPRFYNFTTRIWETNLTPHPPCKNPVAPLVFQAVNVFKTPKIFTSSPPDANILG